MWNTLFLAFASVILTNVFGLLFALAINRMLKTRYILRTLLFLPVVLSPLAVAYVWKFIFQFNGPLNGFLGMIGLDGMQKVWLADPTWSIWAILITVVWQQTGFVMVIYLAGLASVPVEVEEAAALDGAGRLGRFWHVTVPAIRPSIAIATTLGIIQGLRIFDQIFALTGGGPAGATETLATEVYKQAFSLGQFGFGSALALVLTLIILVFAILQQFATRDRDDRGRSEPCSAIRRLTAVREVLVWIVTLIGLLPLYILVVTAFKTDEEALTTSAVAPPTSLDFGAFVEVLTAGGRNNIPMSILNSVIITGGAILGLVLLGSVGGVRDRAADPRAGRTSPTTSC